MVASGDNEVMAHSLGFNKLMKCLFLMASTGIIAMSGASLPNKMAMLINMGLEP